MRAKFELDRITLAPTENEHAPARTASPTVSERVPREYLDTESFDSRSTDPEFLDSRYDATQNDSAINLDRVSDKPSHFVVEAESSARNGGSQENPRLSNEAPVPFAGDSSAGSKEAPSKQHDFVEFSKTPATQSERDDTWRREVSARLSKYQARRRLREPRYPSLQLKFESQEAWRSPSPGGDVGPAPGAATAIVEKTENPLAEMESRNCPPSKPTSRIIEFPRSSAGAPNYSEELAEPVFDRPRILEAPELVPAVPALGGILIEPVDVPAEEKRPGFEMPLQSARMARRFAATLVDAIIVCAGLAFFGYVSWRVADLIPSFRSAASILGVAGAILWAAYQYLLLVHCGTTAGLKLAKLRLSNFDGSSVPRKMRRWRVLASTLSGLSIGLGYAWCFLDEDQLCWHDRITRTYIAPKS
ncbi:MAG: RDD family protein [Terriglobales bacterium]